MPNLITLYLSTVFNTVQFPIWYSSEKKVRSHENDVVTMASSAKGSNLCYFKGVAVGTYKCSSSNVCICTSNSGSNCYCIRTATTLTLINNQYNILNNTGNYAASQGCKPQIFFLSNIYTYVNFS